MCSESTNISLISSRNNLHQRSKPIFNSLPISRLKSMQRGRSLNSKQSRSSNSNLFWCVAWEKVRRSYRPYVHNLWRQPSFPCRHRRRRVTCNDWKWRLRNSPTDLSNFTLGAPTPSRHRSHARTRNTFKHNSRNSKPNLTNNKRRSYQRRDSYPNRLLHQTLMMLSWQRDYSPLKKPRAVVEAS